MINKYTGKGIRVGIVDSGIQNINHPDIKDNIIGGWNFSLDRKKKNDIGSNIYHGQAVASVITSIAPDVEIVVAKVLDYFGEGTPRITAKGIRYCIEQHCDIINCSIAGTKDRELEKAVKEAFEAGIIIVASSGNTGDNKKHYPACYENVITVGAMDKEGNRANFSTHNEFVDILALGVDVKVAFRDGWITDSGTSYSSPHITGILTVLKHKFKEEFKRNPTREELYNEMINIAKINNQGYRYIE